MFSCLLWSGNWKGPTGNIGDGLFDGRRLALCGSFLWLEIRLEKMFLSCSCFFRKCSAFFPPNCQDQRVVGNWILSALPESRYDRTVFPPRQKHTRFLLGQRYWYFLTLGNWSARSSQPLLQDEGDTDNAKRGIFEIESIKVCLGSSDLKSWLLQTNEDQCGETKTFKYF